MAFGTLDIMKGQMMMSGFAISAAAIITSSLMAYSMVISCVGASAKYKRCDSELCAEQRKSIFIVICLFTSSEGVASGKVLQNCQKCFGGVGGAGYYVRSKEDVQNSFESHLSKGVRLLA